ncbi:37929_t:CDS:2, partial [Gigaspora margarita]
NNATASYDDSILVIEVFDDDEEESNYELKESIINAFHLFIKNLAKEYKLIEGIINALQQLMNNLNKEKQENKQIKKIEKLFLEQENQFKEEFQKEKTQLQTNQAMNYNSVKESTVDINILQEQIDDEESINAINYNFVKKTPADSVKEKDMNKESYDIE